VPFPALWGHANTSGECVSENVHRRALDGAGREEQRRQPAQQKGRTSGGICTGRDVSYLLGCLDGIHVAVELAETAAIGPIFPIGAQSFHRIRSVWLPPRFHGWSGRRESASAPLAERTWSRGGEGLGIAG